MADRAGIYAEVDALRDRAVATLPAEEDDPSPSSAAWALGLGRLVAWGALGGGRTLLERRRAALQIAAVAVALVERIDRELHGEPAPE
jgi:hypothetical protein